MRLRTADIRALTKSAREPYSHKGLREDKHNMWWLSRNFIPNLVVLGPHGPKFKKRPPD